MQRPLLPWRRLPNLAGAAVRGQAYTVDHRNRSYRLFIYLRNGIAELQDWTDQPRRSLGVLPVSSVREAKVRAEVKLVSDLERLLRLVERPNPKPEAPSPEPKRSGAHPLVALRLHLARLHDFAMHGDEQSFLELSLSPRAVEELATLFRAADESLTGKPPDRPGRFVNEARNVLEGGASTLQLSDGGYSRVSISIMETPQMWLDKGLSTPRVVQVWNSILNRGL